MSGTHTLSSAAFVSGLRPGSPSPPRPIGVVRTGFADCVGTMIAGSIEDPPKILRKALSPPPGDASLYLVGPRVPAPEAAWINGTAAHALDYDDVALRGHPSAVLVPAILAEAESLKATRRADGAAYVAGYEVWADLQRRDPRTTMRRAGTPPASSAPSALRRPAPLCAASTPRRRRWPSRSVPRRALGWCPTSAP